MNSQRAAAALAALTILAGMPAVTFAQTTPAPEPNLVGRLSVTPSESVANGEQTLPGSVDLAFKNVSDLAETEVSFELIGSDGDLGTLRDSGHFAPGITIRHHFFDPNGSLDGAATVTVSRVTFADGSVWFNEPYLEQLFPTPHVRFGPALRQSTNSERRGCGPEGCAAQPG